jgi:hypothetical protein
MESAMPLKNDNSEKRRKYSSKYSVEQLAILLKVHDPEKLLNILVIKQQMNIISPPEVVIENVGPSPGIDSILKAPSKVFRKKPKNRNMKITYGVMSSNKVVDEMRVREAEEKQADKEKEEDGIDKEQRQKEIKELDEKLRGDREKLKALRAQNTEKTKEGILKRKTRENVKKERGNELTQRPEIQEPAEKKRRIRVKIENDSQ